MHKFFKKINNKIKQGDGKFMEKKDFEIKQGIKAHFIKTDLFKTNMISCIITVPLIRENVTKNALIVSMLRRGTANFKTQLDLSRELENLYGAAFECGIDKYGDNQILKFYADSINDKFALNQEEILKNTLNILLDIICNPLLENGKFKEEYLKVEKENLSKIIKSKIDDKDLYAYETCISKMYGDNGFGLYKYGYLEDLENITVENLTEHYNNLIQNSKMDIFISGDFDEKYIKEIILNNQNIQKLRPRIENYILNNELTEKKQTPENVNEITETMDVTQGKLVIGMDVNADCDKLQFKTLLYNIVLGSGANSLLFQNVREKESLAYSIKSLYVKQKANIFIRAGIEIPNFEKAVRLIEEQLEIMKKGEFSDNDLASAKEYVKAGIVAIETEQDTGIVYYIGQEISKTDTTLEEYLKNIEEITKQDIMEIAQNIKINTVYFLKNEKEEADANHTK